jgi:NAD(P)H dehydrogenase (quinone)
VISLSPSEYENTGIDKALSLTSDMGIFSYCRLEIKRHFFFGKADKTDPETIGEWIEEVKLEF